MLEKWVNTLPKFIFSVVVMGFASLSLFVVSINSKEITDIEFSSIFSRNLFTVYNTSYDVRLEEKNLIVDRNFGRKCILDDAPKSSYYRINVADIRPEKMISSSFLGDRIDVVIPFSDRFLSELVELPELLTDPVDISAELTLADVERFYTRYERCTGTAFYKRHMAYGIQFFFKLNSEAEIETVTEHLNRL